MGACVGARIRVGSFWWQASWWWFSLPGFYFELPWKPYLSLSAPSSAVFGAIIWWFGEIDAWCVLPPSMALKNIWAMAEARKLLVKLVVSTQVIASTLKFLIPISGCVDLSTQFLFAFFVKNCFLSLRWLFHLYLKRPSFGFWAG